MNCTQYPTTILEFLGRSTGRRHQKHRRWQIRTPTVSAILRFAEGKSRHRDMPRILAVSGWLLNLFPFCIWLQHTLFISSSWVKMAPRALIFAVAATASSSSFIFPSCISSRSCSSIGTATTASSTSPQFYTVTDQTKDSIAHSSPIMQLNMADGTKTDEKAAPMVTGEALEQMLQEWDTPLVVDAYATWWGIIFEKIVFFYFLLIFVRCCSYYSNFIGNASFDLPAFIFSYF